MGINIVFDIGNVLLEYQPVRTVEKIFNDPVKKAIILKAVFQSQGWKQVDRGVITFDQHYDNLVERFPQYQEEIKWILDNWHKDMPKVPGMAVVLKKLKEAGYPLYILSNTSSRFYTYSADVGLFKLFDGITLSAEVHLLKPEIEIFTRFCQIHGVVPRECLFIDDMRENVTAALNAGWQAHHFQDAALLRDHLEERLGIVI